MKNVGFLMTRLISDLNVKLYISDLNVKLDISKHTIQQQDQSLVEKERECVRRVQAAREEEFEKLAKVENEK